MVKLIAVAEIVKRQIRRWAELVKNVKSDWRPNKHASIEWAIFPIYQFYHFGHPTDFPIFSFAPYLLYRLTITHYAMSARINESIIAPYQSAIQPTSQPIAKPMNKSTNQPMRRPTISPTTQPIRQSTHQ